MNTAALLFGSTFCLVFFLGLQSLNVNNGHKMAAFLTSFGIGASNLVLFKLAPDASGMEIAAFLTGAPFGIVASMYAHPWLVRLIGKKNNTHLYVVVAAMLLVAQEDIYGLRVSDRVDAPVHREWVM